MGSQAFLKQSCSMVKNGSLLKLSNIKQVNYQAQLLFFKILTLKKLQLKKQIYVQKTLNNRFNKYNLQLSDIKMEDVEGVPRCTIFASATYTIICSLVNDLLKVRAEKTAHNFEQIFILHISPEEFPDYLRHTPFDTTLKLYDYIELKKEESIKFVEGKFTFRVNEAEIGELISSKYMKINEHLEEPVVLKNDEFWDLTTIHAHQYKIAHFVQKQEPGWTQITGRHKLSHEKQYKVKIRYVKYGSALSIGVGFTTQERKKFDYSGDVEHYESAAYWSRHGYKRGCICSNGYKIVDWDCLLYNGEGEVLSIKFNPKDMTILWENGRKAITTNLEHSFMDKELYFFIVMHDVGSKVQIIE